MTDDKTISIEELAQDAHNFNRGNEQGQQLMTRSFQELGAGRSILVDKNGNIIAGNKSQQAAIAAGIKRVRVIETDGTELVAVKRTDVDINSAEGRKMAYLDNLTTQVNLTWDKAEIESVEADVDGFAISDYGIDLGFSDADPDEADKVEEDDFDPDKEHYDPVTQPGDIIRLGNHRLMCGDSTKPDDVARLMQGELADLWLTDPPYNVEYVGAKDRMLSHMGVKELKHEEIENDVMSNEQFAEFLKSAFKNCADVLKDIGAYYVWAPQDRNINELITAFNYAGLPIKQQLIWVKTSFVMGWNDYKYIHEPCYYGWKGKQREHYFVNAQNRTTVWGDTDVPDYRKMKKSELVKLLDEIYLYSPTPTTVINCPKPQRSADHPTMKPVRLFGYQMANSSRPGDIILDTFGGSGTTIVAAEQLGRKARLMELDPKYCDVIIARWEKLTGQKAERITQQ